MKNLWRKLIANELGQDLAEYGIALAVISVGIVVAMGVISADVQTLWTTASAGISSVASAVGN
jgi:Flp pilus assembly pilin Flp